MHSFDRSLERSSSWSRVAFQKQRRPVATASFSTQTIVVATYLYVEQEQGAQLAVFNVTDPAHMKSVVTMPLTVPGPFDFVRPLDGKAELIRFRDGKTVGVLDLTKVRKPSIRIVAALVDTGQTESLGESGADAGGAGDAIPVAAGDGTGVAGAGGILLYAADGYLPGGEWAAVCGPAAEGGDGEVCAGDDGITTG